MANRLLEASYATQAVSHAHVELQKINEDFETALPSERARIAVACIEALRLLFWSLSSRLDATVEPADLVPGSPLTKPARALCEAVADYLDGREMPEMLKGRVPKRGNQPLQMAIAHARLRACLGARLLHAGGRPAAEAYDRAAKRLTASGHEEWDGTQLRLWFDNEAPKHETLWRLYQEQKQAEDVALTVSHSEILAESLYFSKI